MAHTKDKLPPHDSWIALAPGESIEIDGALNERWQEKTRAGRDLRGHVLAVCFEIEFSLDLLIATAFFPEVGRSRNMQSADEHREIFDELFLKGTILTFSRKINLFRRLRSRMQWLAPLVSDELLARLDKLRDIRNRFAHYPISFSKVQVESCTDLLASLVCRDKTITLDGPFINELNELLSSVRTTMQDINKAVFDPQIGPSTESTA